MEQVLHLFFVEEKDPVEQLRVEEKDPMEQEGVEEMESTEEEEPGRLEPRPLKSCGYFQ